MIYEIKVLLFDYILPAGKENCQNGAFDLFKQSGNPIFAYAYFEQTTTQYEEKKRMNVRPIKMKIY